MSFATKTPTISPEDLDLIKKTAFYTSQYPGIPIKQKFTTKGHSLYPLYTSLVEQYRLLLENPPEPTPPDEVLTHAHLKAKQAVAAAPATAPAQDPEPEQSAEPEVDLAFAQIDWQNFVVLEHITFSVKDLSGDIPTALTLEDIQKTPLEERGNVISRITAKQELISPFTGEKVKASEYDEHVRIHNIDRAASKSKRKDAESNLYYDDVEDNLREWKRRK